MADEDELKMWLAVRADLAMPPGKLAALAGHAFGAISIWAWLNTTPATNEYFAGAEPKIVVSVENEDELRRCQAEAKAARIYSRLIVDAGRTYFDGPTPTVCAFGPARRSELPPFLRKLRLYED